MAYLERLKAGSEFHKVKLHSDGSFSIQAANNDSEECRERFHEIVDEAIAKAPSEGYGINPKRSSRDPKGRWDFAVITIS